MKSLVIGAGSMGRRRLRDLLYLGAGEVLLYEPVEERMHQVAEAFGVPGFADLDKALAEKPSIIVVSTPPALHDQYVKRAMDLKVSIFAEVPFNFDLASISKVASQLDSYPAVLGVSHTLRYYPPVRLIHDLLHQGAIGKLLYFEYSLGNYLPDWHPYEDYRQFYAGDARLGGAGMDMIFHEVSAIEWWMGPIQSVQARLAKVSNLEINGPDNHDALVTFASGTRGFFHHDLIEQGTTGRHARIVGEEGTIEWHQNQPEVRLYRSTQKGNEQLGFNRAADWSEALEASREIAEILARQRVKSGTVRPDAAAGFNFESCYLREMRHFIEASQGRHPYTMATIKEELHTVRVFHAIRQSSDDRRGVTV